MAQTRASLLIPVLMLATAPTASAKHDPDRTFPVMGGRLAIKLPDKTQSSARPPESIMSAAPSQESETRFILALAPGRLVVFFKELYELAPATDDPLNKFLSESKPDAHPSTFTVDGIRVLMQGPTQWSEVISGGELLESALLVLPDRTIVKAGFFVSPDARDKESLRALARASLHTLTAGKKLVTGGKLVIAGIAVSLPDGWLHTSQEGPDFSVHSLRPLAVWDTTASGIGIYEGGHAAYQHNQGDEKIPFTIEKGQWLGAPVEWHVHSGANPMHEAIVEWKKGEGVRHVWYYGAEAKAVVDAMRRQ